MDHIAFNSSADAGTAAAASVVILILAIAGFAFIYASDRRAKNGGKNAVPLSVGVALMVTALAFLGATIFKQVENTVDGFANNPTTQYQDAIFTEYGIDLDQESVHELGFPKDKPEGPEIFGTTEVTGFDGDAVLSIEVRLIWNGEQYELFRSATTDEWVPIQG